MARTLQTEILKRFMDDKQYEALYKKYKASALGPGGKSRKYSLEMPIDADTYSALKTYIQDTDTPSREIEKALGCAKGGLRSKLATASFRLLYQKQHLLK